MDSSLRGNDGPWTYFFILQAVFSVPTWCQGMKQFRNPLPPRILFFLLCLLLLATAALSGMGFLSGTRSLLELLPVLAALALLVSLYRQSEGNRLHAQQAARKARAAKSLIAEIFNSANDGMLLIDRNFTIMHVNARFLAVTGFSSKDLLGRKCHDLFAHARCHTGECPLARIAAGERDVEHEMVFHSKKNPERAGNFRIASLPFRDDLNGFAGILQTWRDIQNDTRDEIFMERALEEAHGLAGELAATNEQIHRQQKELEQAHAQLKQTQAQILQQEKMASIGQLAAGVAHEINNPMGFISSNLHTLEKYMARLGEYLLALEQQNPPESMSAELQSLRRRLKIDYLVKDAPHLIQESLEGAERVKTIVLGLRSFSRVDQAQLIAADINECLESTINIIWNELKYRCEVEREYGPLPRTVCNPQQLNQVFMNLLLNAAQSMETQGLLRIRTWAEEGWLCVGISDTGCGIPPDGIKRIFEPFYTTKDVGKGTGLGLSIVYDIIKKHNGEVQVASEVGKGSTFTVKIPLVEKIE